MRKKIDLAGAKHVHFIGIGGISMSGLAETLLHDGFTVSGSDRAASPTTNHLRDAGIHIAIGCNAANITTSIDLVVYTAAIKPDNPEFAQAIALGIPMMVRAELIGAILKAFKYAVCIAGTHGKTSTTALVTRITQAAGLDPTVNIGGYIGDKNYFIGNSPYFVLESCEYSNSFHHWHPYIGTILNVDIDHLDFFADMDAIIETFAKFARNIRPNGVLVIQEDVPGFDRITAGLKCEVVTFGASQNATYSLQNITNNTIGTSSFDATEGPYIQTRIDLPLPGKHNMYNALAAYAVARELGIEPQVIARTLSEAEGVKRRYQFKGMYDGTTIIDDYAHHPTEIKACLAAAREAHAGRIICLFQPHTYTRTRDLFDDFSYAFAAADMTMFVPIFAAREPYDPTISSAMLAERVAQNSPLQTCCNCNSLKEAEEFLRANLKPGDLLITMGAGDVYLVGENLLTC
ncbi:MAG: UDP-N-acetylmuramate--L-alanine ligase [Defluviitaleaceae bacterium]|nr:UDP-N-acetylmuramate--L-alanine ligase [Defluviitaleaceae bacterium]